MIKYTHYFIISLICLVFGICDVCASSYNASVDVTYGTYENRLFNLAVNNDLKVQNDLIIFRTDNYNYYAIYSSDSTLNNNVLTFNDAIVLRYYRYDNYNSSWYFEKTSDSQAVIYINSYSLGNVKGSSYISNFNDLQDYTYRYYSILLLMLLGILLFFRCFRK